jgi:predicted metal-dependent enzyme (double-stranded beta helix superfamily)
VLTAEQRHGSPDGYRSHTPHVEPDGSFSIIALVWRPGQVTRIHDHVTWWCVFGVIKGVEHEELFDADLSAHLVLVHLQQRGRDASTLGQLVTVLPGPLADRGISLLAATRPRWLRATVS